MDIYRRLASDWNYFPCMRTIFNNICTSFLVQYFQYFYVIDVWLEIFLNESQCCTKLALGWKYFECKANICTILSFWCKCLQCKTNTSTILVFHSKYLQYKVNICTNIDNIVHLIGKISNAKTIFSKYWQVFWNVCNVYNVANVGVSSVTFPIITIWCNIGWLLGYDWKYCITNANSIFFASFHYRFQTANFCFSFLKIAQF